VASLRDAVYRVVAAIPPGEVLTYGEVAAECGHPGAARAVGRVMANSDDDLPWWRIVAANGRLVPGYEAEHTRRLRAEGVLLRHGRVALAERRPARTARRP
jgi:methylated-DNA-protein-cysteine methyltransferase related protein